MTSPSPAAPPTVVREALLAAKEELEGWEKCAGIDAALAKIDAGLEALDRPSAPPPPPVEGPDCRCCQHRGDVVNDGREVLCMYGRHPNPIPMRAAADTAWPCNAFLPEATSQSASADAEGPRLGQAACVVLDHGHRDTCGSALGPYPCSCGHDGLARALAAEEARRKRHLEVLAAVARELSCYTTNDMGEQIDSAQAALEDLTELIAELGSAP